MSSDAVAGWPSGIRTVYYRTTLDQSMQPMLLFSPDQPKKQHHDEHPDATSSAAASHSSSTGGETQRNCRPLLVALHTWSASYRQSTPSQTLFATWCIHRNWHFIHPNFRGANNNPDACGSDLAIQDVVDAVAYIQDCYNLDQERVYVVGVSGGAHMALLLAGRRPDIWAGVSAWAPISNVYAWWTERNEANEEGMTFCTRYARNIEQVVGGVRPDQSGDAARRLCDARSPNTYLSKARGVNIDIYAGIYDGHDGGGAVPFKHALHAYNAVVSNWDSEKRFDAEFIETFFQRRKLPQSMTSGDTTSIGDNDNDIHCDSREVFLCRYFQNVRVTIFDGRHEVIHNVALNWLAAQRRNERAKWNTSIIFSLSQFNNVEGSKSGE